MATGTDMDTPPMAPARSDSQGTAVSVVIPTVGRPELVRAVRSARLQDHKNIEIIVVVDAAQESVDLANDVHDLADKVIWTGGGRRGAAARNLGVRAAGGDWIAFLDDDDEWLPGKISAQLEHVVGAGQLAVVSCRQVQFDPKDGSTSGPIPVMIKNPGEDVAEYLFLNRAPSAGRASMYTSSLMCSREVAEQVSWDETLRRHQDWDWLIRASDLPGVTVTQVPEVLVRIQTGSVGSISATQDWEASLAWALRVLRPRSAQVYVDFLAAQTLRYAIGARSLRGVGTVVRAIFDGRTLPGVGPLIIGLAGVLPRRRIEAIITRFK